MLWTFYNLVNTESSIKEIFQCKIEILFHVVQNNNWVGNFHIVTLITEWVITCACTLHTSWKNRGMEVRMCACILALDIV